LKAAKKEFRELFLIELGLLEERSSTQDTYNILNPAFGKHKSAYSRFRYCLKEKDRHRLDDLWSNYCTNELGQQDLDIYVDNGSLDKRVRLRKLAKRKNLNSD
jgi:hypothetical protein